MMTLAGISIVIGALVGAGATGLSMRVARRFGILDYPGKIKIHRDPTPRFGGLGIVLGTLAASLGVTAALGLRLTGVLAGGLIIAFTGAADDIWNLSPMQKLLGQLVGAILYAGLLFARLPLDGLPTIMSTLLAGGTILLVCFMTNSLNLLDGMDGLAAGTTGIIASFLLGLAVFEGSQSATSLLGALVGSCIGFLLFNLPPAKTFMGDVGSLFLGFIVAVAAADRVLASLSWSGTLGVVLILAVPIADTGFAIMRRLRSRKSVMTGDRYHLYDCVHRLTGLDTWRTLVLMWGLEVVLGAIGLTVYGSPPVLAVALSGLSLAGLLLLAIKVGALGGIVVRGPENRDALEG